MLTGLVTDRRRGAVVSVAALAIWPSTVGLRPKGLLPLVAFDTVRALYAVLPVVDVPDQMETLESESGFPLATCRLTGTGRTDVKESSRPSGQRAMQSSRQTYA